MLRKGADIHATRDRRTALGWAAHVDDVRTATRLPENGAEVEGVDKTMFTPLEITLKFGSTEAAKLLVAHGARIPKDITFRSAQEWPGEWLR
jgi:ankyrin repeat protein